MRRPVLISLGVGGALLLLLAVFAVARLSLPPRSVADEAVATDVIPDVSPSRIVPSPAPATPAVPAAQPSEPAQPTLATPSSSPTALLPRPQAFAPLLYDDFSQLTSGWTPLFVDRQGSVNGYSAEHFAFSTARPGRLLYNLLPRLSFAPARYSVELEPVEGSGMFGLMLEVRGDPADYGSLAFYGVGLTTEGNVLLLVKGAAADLQVVPIAEGAISPLVPGKPTRLTIDRRVDRLIVRVDDKEELTVAAPAPEAGTIGFFARADERLAVHFDNLLLTTAAPGSEPPCAGIRPLFATTSNGEAMQGADVALVQRRLTRLGYAAGREEVYGPATAAAVTRFQARNKLPADGVVSAQTWCRLLSSDAILATADQSEQAAIHERYRPVTIALQAELPAPLFVSVRGAERRWQIALALPGRSSLHYIDTGGDALDPAWLPEQGLLAFSSVRGGDDREAVWILDTGTGQVQQVSPPALNSEYPTWSPDGRALMFTGTPLEGNDKTARNYVYTRADSRVTPWGSAPAGWSDWSTVGTVVFTRWTGRSFDIFAANLDGSNEVNLTNSDDYHEDIPAWSPGGDRIAFVRNPKSAPDDRQVYIMQADGSEVQPVTSLPGPNSNPIWLDATTIVFAHQANADVRQPYLLRLPGDLRRLSASEERIWFMQRFANTQVQAAGLFQQAPRQRRAKTRAQTKANFPLMPDPGSLTANLSVSCIIQSTAGAETHNQKGAIDGDALVGPHGIAGCTALPGRQCLRLERR